jgi:hypothetical protein
MHDLVAQTDELLARVERDGAAGHLRQALVRFRRAVEDAPQPTDARNAGRALSRFCTEHMDWDTDLYRQYMALIGPTQRR